MYQQIKMCSWIWKDEIGGASTVWERCRQSCGGDTRMRILGRRTTKYGIILKWKIYEMRACTRFMWLKIGTIELFFSSLR